MKTLMITLWLALPLAVAAYHYGPGQDRLKMDAAAQSLAAALKASQAGDHAAAVEACQEALAALPPEAVAESRQIRLLQAKEQLPVGQLPEAHDALQALHTDLSADPHADPAVKRETRTALATSQYYLAWLMRLEGGSEEQWMPEVEASRQHFRHLAEEAEAEGNQVMITTQRENLESSIRLARMELTELQGLPLPKQCKNCKSGKCAPAKPQRKDPPQDSRNAGKTMGPDNSGS